MAPLLAMVVLVSACGGAANQASADETSSAAAPGVLRIATVGTVSIDPATLNPTHATDVLVADLLFDGLTAYDASTKTVEPALASTWSTSDGVSWAFTLDPHRRFSDGSKVTAADVVASLKRVSALRSSSIGGSRLDLVSSITASTPATVDITLTGPDYELPALLADPTYGIVKDQGATVPSVSAATVTSGAFEIGSASAGSIELASVDEKRTNVDGIELVRFADVDHAVAALESGAVDITPLGGDGIAPPRSTETTVSAATIVLEVRSDFGPWADPAAHTALLHTIDRVAVSATATRHEFSVADSIVPGDVVTDGACATGCAPAADGPPGLAVAAAAGTVTLDVPTGARATKVGAELVRQFATAGLPATARSSDAASIQATLAAGSLQMAVFGVVGLAPTPDPYLAAVLGSHGSENLSGFDSPAFDAALTAARSTVDPAARAAAYRAAEALALGSAPVIPLVALGERFAVSKAVTGVTPAAGVLFGAEDVGLSR